MLFTRGFIPVLILLGGCSGSSLDPLNQGDVILAFGDSLTYGTGVAADLSYPAVLESITGYSVIRSGVPGEISSAGLKRLPGILKKENPRLVVICHGGNDVLRRLNRQQTEANLRSMIELVRQHGAQVILIAVPKISLFPSAAKFYDAIEEDTGVPIEFDILSQLQTDSKMKSDPIHFNRVGYRKMAEAVRDLLKDNGAI
ncbi:MAG: arylesterase [Proteobacteria bacterium]|nr:arylesterase [Pseudomonadota bacterium]